MLRTSENETEILLGNKQLLGIFFVIAVLLGVAFTGGYLVGRGSNEKKTTVASAPAGPASPGTTTTGGETHSIGATPNGDAEPARSGNADQTQTAPAPIDIPAANDEPPLGSPKKEHPANAGAAEAAPVDDTATPLVPQPGQIFLQVAAVSRDEAEGVADVLHRKGFRAHAVPKPGNPKIYRVLIGPVRDAGDLSATRDALRKRAGFREIIVQKY